MLSDEINPVIASLYQGGPKVIGPFSLDYNFLKVLITQSQNFKQR